MPATTEERLKRRKRKKYIFLLITLVIITGFIAFIADLYKKNREFDWWQKAGKQEAARIRQSLIANDTMAVLPAGAHYNDRGNMFCFFFGKHYRDIWAIPVKVRVFNLNDLEGGLEVLKKGGNQQTLSLRMKSMRGKNFVLRTIDKDQSKALVGKTDNPAIRFLFRDQASALNPYASIIIPTLANAAGIYHTNPEIFYIPPDNRLGVFLEEFAGSLVIFEEYPDNSWVGTFALDSPECIVSTSEMLKETADIPGVFVNYQQFARCRLFDIFIGDWDRHGGQWKWAGIRKGDSLEFRPIPRDRDMSFYKYNDGLMNSLSVLATPKLQTFGKEFGSIKGLIYNARHIDSALLRNLSEEEWLKIAMDLKSRLTDNVIDEAVKKFPPGVYEKIGKEIAEALKFRRVELTEAAERYYDLLQEN